MHAMCSKTFLLLELSLDFGIASKQYSNVSHVALGTLCGSSLLRYLQPFLTFEAQDQGGLTRCQRTLPEEDGLEKDEEKPMVDVEVPKEPLIQEAGPEDVQQAPETTIEEVEMEPPPGAQPSVLPAQEPIDGLPKDEEKPKVDAAEPVEVSEEMPKRARETSYLHR